MGELVLKGGRVIDPSQNLDGIADVVFAEGRVKAVGRDAPHGRDAEVRDAKGLIVTPGLVDLHTHVYWGAAAARPPSSMPVPRVLAISWASAGM